MGTPLGMSFGAVGPGNPVPPEVQVEHMKALQIQSEPQAPAAKPAKAARRKSVPAPAPAPEPVVEPENPPTIEVTLPETLEG